LNDGDKMKKIVLVFTLCIFFCFNLGGKARADEPTEFYTYFEREVRILNEYERIETLDYGYKNFVSLYGTEGFNYGLPRIEYSGVDEGKVLGVLLNEKRLDRGFYSTSIKDGQFVIKLDTENGKQNELEQKFLDLNDFEITFLFYIKQNQDFKKEEGNYIFKGSYESEYDKYDLYHKFTLILPYPSEHSLKTTARMILEMKEYFWYPPIDIEIKRGDLKLSWWITYSGKEKQFEHIINKKPYITYGNKNEEDKELKRMIYTLNVEYSYQTLPLLQLLCALIISFPIGFTFQFFKDVEKGEYGKIEKLKTRKNKVIRKIKFFGIKNFKLKLKYSFFSFIILVAIILILFAPNILNVEAIRFFHVKLSFTRLFSINTAKTIQRNSVRFFLFYIAATLMIFVWDYRRRKKHKQKLSQWFQMHLEAFTKSHFLIIITIISVLLYITNGNFQHIYAMEFFFLEFALEIYIFLAFVAYYKLYRTSIH
jgi:hypothetical protein